MSSTVVESRVIAAPLEVVWKAVRPATFGFWSKIQNVHVEGSSDAVGSTRKITFKDGTLQTFRILEISDVHHSITYEVIDSNPPIDVLAAIHSISLKKVTSDNSTFVQFSSDFSSGEFTAAVVEDSKYKKKEALVDLAKAVE